MQCNQCSKINIRVQIYCLEHHPTDIVPGSPPAAVPRSGEGVRRQGEGGPGQPRAEVEQPAEDGEADLAQEVDSEEAVGAEAPLYSLERLPRLPDGRDHRCAVLGYIQVYVDMFAVLLRPSLHSLLSQLASSTEAVWHDEAGGEKEEGQEAVARGHGEAGVGDQLAVCHRLTSLSHLLIE